MSLLRGLQKGDINYRQDCFGEVGLWDNLEVTRRAAAEFSGMECAANTVRSRVPRTQADDGH